MWCLWTGTLFSVVAATAGLIAFSTVIHVHDESTHEVMLIHGNLLYLLELFFLFCRTLKSPFQLGDGLFIHKNTIKNSFPKIVTKNFPQPSED